jgi:U32 family peptidase
MKQSNSKKPELLSPVQDLTSLKAAIAAGADSIYFGTKELNMRIGAKNFELKDTKKVINLCHKNKVKAYFTLNTLIYDAELNKLSKILKKLKKEKIDAIICWDFSVIKECEKLNLPIHLSTQANVSNYETIAYLKNKIKNLKRVNLARELSLTQIKSIISKIKKNKLNIKIETFVHGAMCVSISGRCFLSQEVFNKSANRGSCLQPCRRKYLIKDIEEKHEFELGEDYILSPKDLCTIEIIDKLIEAKINTFKIEGRNRSPEYVKTTTECYREAIDNKYADKNKLKTKLSTVYNRGFSTGFYLGKPINEWSQAYGSKATKKKIYLGKVKNFYKKQKVAEILIETNKLKLNDTIMFQGPTTGVVEQKVDSMEKNHKKINKAKKGESIALKTKDKVRENDKVFLIEHSKT